MVQKAQGKAKPDQIDHYNYAKGRGCKGGIAPSEKKISGTSKTRVPFSAMCNSSKQQGVVSKSADLTPDIDCDEYYTVSESVGTSTCHENTSGIEPRPDLKSTEESLVHTSTLSSGSSSEAHASSGFISHYFSRHRPGIKHWLCICN